MFNVDETTQIRQTLATVERALERYEGALEVLLILAAAQERRMSAAESLALVQPHVRGLQDVSLAVLYDLLMAPVQGQSGAALTPGDYGAFVERLAGFASEVASDLYQADIRLIAALKMSATDTPGEHHSSVAT